MCKVFTSTNFGPNGLRIFRLKWHQEVSLPKEYINFQPLRPKGWKLCIIVEQIWQEIFINLLELWLYNSTSKNIFETIKMISNKQDFLFYSRYFDLSFIIIRLIWTRSIQLVVTQVFNVLNVLYKIGVWLTSYKYCRP